MASFLHKKCWDFFYVNDRSSHLFQRVASFLLPPSGNIVRVNSSKFSSLSESGFIPTLLYNLARVFGPRSSSHLFQRVASFLQILKLIHGVFDRLGFSSLSESGFIPTNIKTYSWCFRQAGVLISFREWLHSY